jgi:regulation of enolase protein 1 (concanavalin A-like superfamily)
MLRNELDGLKMANRMAPAAFSTNTASSPGHACKLPAVPTHQTADGWRSGWGQRDWFNPPPLVTREEDDLLVTAACGSDLWRHTSYGFIHDNGHALLTDFPDGTATEVTFIADFSAQFDQAGLLIRADAKHWIKAGVELADGVLQLGAVVTRGASDWSVAPVPEWLGQPVVVRASRKGDALTVRARSAEEPWRLVRVAPLPRGPLRVGLMCCAPTRAGLVVRFTDLRLVEADRALHP